ncbi:MAG: DNA primase [Ruminiclostridium sp.]|nr:DNA primase [Ruminiclostridium sp.]MBQ9933422.1 DNA primase [Ruminiclostridium sp.]
MAIPSAFLDELVARSDIVDVVSDYVTLTPKGGSYWGLCPFHGEKTASFHVLPDRQLYHCFGCGKGGGVISFVMELENLPYVDAVRLLAKRAGMEFPERDMDESSRRKRAKLLALNKEAARFFHSQLHSPIGREGLEYLRGRGLSKGIMTRFGLGFAPESWDSLIKAMSQKGFSKSDLLDAGLAVSNQKGGIYDRFRNRVMFPIIDLRGDVIGFGGRVLGDATPKYLNSPDSPVFNKSRNLFALNLAKTTKLGRIVLTEGYMDTISLYQAGFDCAVASLGTALTADHAKLLSRFTKEVVICYDSDTAGVQAANRAIPLLEKTGLKVRVLRVTGAKDPDEFIRKFGPDAFSRLLDQSENYVEYNLRQIQSKYDLSDPVQKTEFARESAGMLAGLHSPVEREVYAGQVAELTGIGKPALLQEIGRARNSKLWAAKKKQTRRDMTPVTQVQPKARQMRYENTRSARAEEGILRLLMLDGALVRETAGLEPEHFSSQYLGKIYAVLRRRLLEGRAIQLGMLEGELDREEIELLAEILRQPEALEQGSKAMADYRAILEAERMKRQVSEEADLLAVRDRLRQKKSI